MELMQKYPQEDGSIGLDDTKRWPVDSDAVKFLSMTTSASDLFVIARVSLTLLVRNI